MEPTRSDQGTFGGGGVEFHKQPFLPVVGLLGGVAMFLGVPWLVLVYGSQLNAVVQTVLIFLAVIGGGLIALAATFFGLVLPAKSWGGGGCDINAMPDAIQKRIKDKLKQAAEQQKGESGAGQSAQNEPRP